MFYSLEPYHPQHQHPSQVWLSRLQDQAYFRIRQTADALQHEGLGGGRGGGGTHTAKQQSGWSASVLGGGEADSIAETAGRPELIDNPDQRIVSAARVYLTGTVLTVYLQGVSSLVCTGVTTALDLQLHFCLLWRVCIVQCDDVAAFVRSSTTIMLSLLKKTFNVVAFAGEDPLWVRGLTCMGE
jgi:hypothetical protein